MIKKLLSIFTAILFVLSSVVSVGAQTYSKEDISSTIEKVISYKMNLFSVSSKEDFISILSENTDNTDTQWLMISLAKYGYDMTSLSAPMQTTALKLYQENAKPTDLQRVSIALSACGVSCENVSGRNILADSTYNNTSIKRQGINAYAYALIALENADSEQNVNEYIEEILKLQLPDGGFALAGEYADVDVTAICIQALAPHRNQNDKVEEVMQEALECLSKKQNQDGGYSSFGVKNCESTAQVISALVASNIDAEKDERFIKNGKNAIDALLEYQNSDGGFAHISGGKSNSMATVQAFNALIDYNSYLQSQDVEIFQPAENDDIVVNVTVTKPTENINQTINQTTENNNISSTENEPDQTAVVENTTIDKSLVEISNNKNASPDEAFLSDKPDKLVPIPTQTPEKNLQSYNGSAVFMISISGLVILFMVLLLVKLIISKKNGEKFGFEIMKRNGEDDEDEN